MERIIFGGVILLALLGTFVTKLQAQSNKLTCQIGKIDEAMPPVYLSFRKKEVIEIDGKVKVQKLLIKITNNSKCSILVQTPNWPFRSRFETVKNEQGKIIKLKPKDSESSEPIFLTNNEKYKIICDFRNRQGKSIQSDNFEGCLVSLSMINSGTSVYFNASAHVFEKNPILKVAYNFEGDDSPLTINSNHASLDLKRVNMAVVAKPKIVNVVK